MLSNKKFEIEQEQTKRELKIALISECDNTTLRRVETDVGEIAMVQIAGIKSVRQEQKGWFHNDSERETILIKYLDDSWERLDMTVESFAEQTGYGKQ